MIHETNGGHADSPWRRHGIAIAIAVVGVAVSLGAMHLASEGRGAGGEPIHAPWAVFLVGIVLTAGLCVLQVRVVAQERRLLEAERKHRDDSARLRRGTQALIDQGPEPAWLKDRDGRYVFCNRAFAGRFGRSQADIAGRSDLDLFDPHTALAKTRRDEEAAVAPGVIEYDETFEIGSVAHRERIRKFAVRDAKGAVIGIAGIAYDISELGEREAAVAEARDVLARRLVAERSRRSAVQEALRSADSRYALATAAAGVGVWDHDMASGRLEVDDAAARLLGLAKGGLPGDNQGWRAAMMDDVGRADDAAAIAAIREGRSDAYDVTFRYAHPSGESRWIQVRGHVVRDAAGQPARILGTFHDVTLLHEAERVAQQGRARFEALFRGNPLVLAVTEIDTGVVREASEGFFSVLGYAREQIVGRSTRDLGIWVDPQERATLVAELKATGRVHDHEVRLRSRTGGVRVMSWSSRILELDGTRSMLSAAVDITERRDAEERLRVIVESAPLGIITVDGDGRFLSVNEAFARMLGYRRDELVGRAFVEVTHPDDRTSNLERARAQVDGTIPGSYQLEKRYVHRGGGVVHARLMTAVVKDAAGGFRYRIAVVEDVTGQRHSERERSEALAFLEATLEATDNGFMIADEHGRLVRWNRRIVDMLGYSEALLAEGRIEPLYQYLLGQVADPEGFRRRSAEVLGDPRHRSTAVLEMNDGRRLERHIEPILQDGRVTGRLWSVRDVTGRA